jgi:hypothetical protein
MKLVEETLQRIAGDALHDDSDHIHVVDHILYWVISVVVTFLVISAWFSELDPATHSPPNWLAMFSAVLLVNVSASFYCNASHNSTCLPNFFD